MKTKYLILMICAFMAIFGCMQQSAERSRAKSVEDQVGETAENTPPPEAPASEQEEAAPAPELESAPAPAREIADVDYKALKPEPPSTPVRDFTVKPVPPKKVKAEWDTFDILVWQFKTQVENHHQLWEAVGARGFHIDRSGDSHDAEWAKKKIFYQDHAADKGFLHLLDREFKVSDSGYGTKVNLFSHGGWVHPRTRSFRDPAIMKKMHDHLRKNVSRHTGTRRMLIAFDDEISTGRFASPHEVCGHPNSVKEFREFLRWRYNDDIAAVNKQWGTDRPRIFVVIGEKKKFPNDSVHTFLNNQYAAQYKAFKAEYGDLKPDILRLRGGKMFVDLPPFAFFQPYKNFSDIPAVSYEWVHKKKSVPLKDWNLASWADFREYMDYQFAHVLRELTLMSNELDPDCPAGYVGGSAPNAWGGHNYPLIKHVVQWVEAYDIGGTNEILRGLNPNIYRVQTYFPPKDWKLCGWVMSYYAAHRNKCFIMWPASGDNSVFTEPGKQGMDGVNDNLKKIAPYTKILIEEPSRQMLASEEINDPIAVYLSQPSLRAVWAMDSDCHGNTWPARSSSLDNFTNSYHQNLIAWFKTLEDLGYQYTVVDEEQLFQGRLKDEKIQVVILPKAVALSANEVDAFEAFAQAGGTVIADNMPGLFDGHCTGLADDNMPVTELFGCTRDSSQGFFDRSEICELNAEKGYKHRGEYDRILAVHKNAKKYKGIPVAENGLRSDNAIASVDGSSVLVARSVGAGKVFLMNLSLLRYLDMDSRVNGVGKPIRSVVAGLLVDSGIVPPILVFEGQGMSPVTEILRYGHPDGSELVGIVKNPVRHGTITGLGEIPGIPADPITVTVKFRFRIKNVRNIMTGSPAKLNSDGKSVTLSWKPWEMLLLKYER